MSPPHLHVAIVGAGLGGVAAAIGISHAGHTVTILEQASQLGEIGAGIQIPPNSSRILAKWNLLPQIEAVSVLPQAFNLRSYRDGKILSRQETMPYCLSKYGAPYLHIHRADFHNVLILEAIRLGVTIKLSSHVSKIDFATPAVILSTGTILPYDLIVGADGLKSVCREELLGRKDPPKLTGDLAYRIVVKTEKMMMRPELREFVENPAINIWMGPESHVVTYLLSGGKLFNVVLACPDDLPEFIQTQKADVSELNERVKDWDPRMRELLGLVEETTKWRLQNSEEMENWSHPSYPGNFVLLGDACHATLPYLASGAAMAVEDGAALGALLSKKKIRDKSQVKDVLRIYEKLRKQRTTKVVKSSSALGKVFHCRDGVEQVERDELFRRGQECPWEGFPNMYRDPVFRPWLWGYDVEKEVERAWADYEMGRSVVDTGERKDAASDGLDDKEPGRKVEKSRILGRSVL